MLGGTGRPAKGVPGDVLTPIGPSIDELLARGLECVWTAVKTGLPKVPMMRVIALIHPEGEWPKSLVIDWLSHLLDSAMFLSEQMDQQSTDARPDVAQSICSQTKSGVPG